MRKLIMLLMLAPTLSMAQAIVSTGAGGPWNQTTTWVGGVVPISTNSTSISIVGPVSVASAVYNSSTPLVIDQATVNIGGILTIDAGAQVNVANAATDLGIAGTGQIQVNGKLVQLNGAAFTGTTALNTFFNAGSIYEHQNANWGTLLTASWNASSTILVTGQTAGSNAGASWAQSIGNFTFNCPNLAAGVANLAGRFTTIAGDVNIVRTGTTGRLMFSNAAGVLNVAIGGNLNIGDGTQAAALWVTSTGTVTVTVAGAVTLSSTSTIASQNATTGTGIIQVNNSNDFQVQLGRWDFVSGAGTGTIILNGGNFFASPGTQVNRSGAGNANINFIGAAANQGIDLDPALTLSGAISLTVGKSSGNVNMQSPLTLNAFTQTGGTLVQGGNTLTINGIINQTGVSNIDASTNSSFIVGGAGAISAGLIFSPAPSLFDTFTMNRAGVTLSTSSAFQITTLNLTAGTLTHSGTLTMENTGIINVTAGILTNTPAALGVYDVAYANTGALNTSNELPTAPSAILRNFTKSAAGVLTLTKNIEINGDLTLSAGTFANGANSITLDGNYISNGTSTTAVGATFTFTGASATLTGSIAPSFRNLVVNGTFTPSISYGVTANYTVGPSGIVNAGAGTVTFGGTTVITNNGTMNLNAVTIGNTFTMTAPAGTLGIAGNFTTTGTFNNGGGTILFNGTTALSAAAVYSNITISVGATVTSANIGQTVSGSMINNGTFNIGTGNLTWTGSGTISGSGNTTVADVNVSGVSCTYTASGNLTLNDDILGAGFFNSSTSAGTVIFAGAGSAVSGTGAKTFRAVSVTGTFTPAITYTLVGVGGLDVTGTLASGGTIIFGGTTQTITGSSLNIAFNTFTTNVGSTLTITPNITINGNLTGDGNIISNGTINFVGLTMSGTGTKTFTNVTVGAGTLNANSNYSISGNLVVTGTLTFSAGAPITTFNGTTTISGAGAATFSFLTITGVLTSSAGTISIVRDFTNNGIFNHGGGTVSFSTTGTVQQQILGSSSTVFNNLVINNVGVATDVTNGLIASLSVDIAGALSFGEANAVFDADGSGSSVFRILSTNDSPATDGRVAAITFAGSSITGNINVQRFVSSEASGRFYRYIASPVVGASVAQLKAVIPVTGTFTDPSDGASSPPCTGCNTTNPSLFSFNEAAAQAFVAFPAAGLASASSFTNGRGYSAYFRHTGLGAVGTVTLNFRGTNPSSAGVVLPVSTTASGYSLVGNPYPSPIVWNNGAGWTKANIGDVIVVRDNATGIHQSYSAAAGTGIVATGQSFWVQSSAGGASLSIGETAKTSGSYSFYRGSDIIEDKVEMLLTKSSTGTTDNARISLVAGSSLSYEPFDGIKFDNSIDNGNGTITQVHDISIMSSDAFRLSVNSVPAVCTQTFNINIRDVLNTGESSMNYTLAINPSGAMKSTNWILHDNTTNTDIDLATTPVYNFTVNIGETVLQSGRYHLPNRFLLKSTPVVIDETKAISSTPVLCSSSEAIITVASQGGLTYGAEVNGIYYPNLAQGDGSAISVFIDNDKLIDGPNTIRIKANSGCTQQFLTTSVGVNKEASYQIASAPNGTLCAAGSIILNATSSQADAVFKWYQTESSSTPIATGAQFITPIITDSTAYLVAAVSPSGCEGARVKVKVAFENSSQAISAVPATPVCKGESMTLSASNTLSGGSFKWYDGINAITPIGTNSELTINALQTTKSYYVSYLSAGGCESDRVEVKAEVVEYNPLLTVQPQTLSVCVGGIQTLKATGGESQAVYKWFESQNATLPLFEGQQYVTEPLFAARTYFLESNSVGGCSSVRVPVLVSVTATPAAPVFNYLQDQICNSGVTKVNITNPTSGIKYLWYSSKLSSESFYEGVSLTTEALSTRSTYFVAAVNSNGCESTDRKEVVIEVTQFVSPAIDTTDPSRLKSNFKDGNQWYFDSKELKGETNEFLAPTASGVYDLRVDFNGCVDWSGSVYITTVVTSIEDEPKEIYVYPNPTSDILKIIIHDREPLQARLLDGKGAFVADVVLSSFSTGWEGQLDVKNLAKGLYLLQLSSGDKNLVHKVIIN